MGGLSAKRASVVALLTAGLFAVALLGAPLAQALPGLPGVHVHLPEPDQVAYFDVIVEGKAVDTLDTHISGTTGPCLVTEDGTVVDTTTYQRGKGVTVEFARYGRRIVVTRAGRIGDSSLATQVREKRKAQGGSQFSPAFPNLPCSVPPYELSSNGDCGKSFARGGAIVLGFGQRGLTLDLTASTKLGGSFDNPNHCGEDPHTGISEEFSLDWPTQPGLEPGPSVTPRALFGRRHAIVVLLRSSDVGKPKKEHRKYNAGTLSGSVDESAFNEATVRLIRVDKP